jgi:hypothetical protein
MMNHIKKMVAPVLIAFFFILYCVGLAFLAIWLPQELLVIRVIYGIIGIGLVIGMLVTLSQRIKEIWKGEEDDLSNY